MLTMLLLNLFLLTLAYVSGQHTTPNPQQQAALQQLRQVYESIDTNGDGGITLEEELAYFDKIDLNGDGKMSYEEFLANRNSGPTSSPVGPQYLRATFNWYDTMGGSLVPDGYLARNDTTYFFNILDVNGDGHATFSEYDIAFVQIGKAIAQQVQTPVGKK